MYDSFLEAMKHLDDSGFRECVLKIRDYALEGIEEESDSPNINIIMVMAKPVIDAAERRYVACVENGKKGAEFGKLGGAPKGNQNARKKQPLKQPLNANVNEDENVNDDADAKADAVTTPTGLKSSFSSSIQGSINQIENDSEQFEEQEERKEPHNEACSHYSKDCRVSAASENISEAPSHSKDDIFVSYGTEPKTSRVGAAARHQQKDEGGMSMSDYVKQVINKGIIRLADMKLRGEDYDKQLLNSTIDNMIYYDYNFTRSSAYAAIMKSIEQYNRNRS